MTDAAADTQLIDADLLASVVGYHPMYVRKLANEGVIPCIREGRRMFFDPDVALPAIADYKANGAGRSHKEETAVADPRPNTSALPEGLLLWHKRVKRLGWALADPTNVDTEDDFVELQTDAGLSHPSRLSQVLDEVSAGKIYVLEPGRAAELILRQLRRSEAPKDAIDHLQAAITVLEEWRRKTTARMDHE
jgi:hypothetical protein